MEELDPKILDPGVRELVMRLRRKGFHTVDSGDGVSKPPEERVFERPHVVMRLQDASAILPEAFRLQYWLERWLVPGEWSCEATFSPYDRMTLLFVWDVTDSMLLPEQEPETIEVVGG